MLGLVLKLIALGLNKLQFHRSSFRCSILVSRDILARMSATSRACRARIDFGERHWHTDDRSGKSAARKLSDLLRVGEDPGEDVTRMLRGKWFRRIPA